MDKKEIKSAIATLSDNGISPYDLLLALGNTDVVPEEIVENRKSRVLVRDGKESPQGYLKNAIEDLQKVGFRGKDQVLKVLKGNAGITTLSGLGSLDAEPADQALCLLHLGFIVVPLIAGADKFFNATTDWGRYVAPSVEELSPLPKKKLLQLIGGLEMIVGVITALNPEIGGYIISAWLGLVTANVLISGENYDVALRDSGLALAALAMARLAKGKATNPTVAA
jgi:hypothetical protein